MNILVGNSTDKPEICDVIVAVGNAKIYCNREANKNKIIIEDFNESSVNVFLELTFGQKEFKALRIEAARDGFSVKHENFQQAKVNIKMESVDSSESRFEPPNKKVKTDAKKKRKPQ